ncbi:MAG TPA: universal stress protein [Actinomycetota bacterium]|nr:universal stress protein [Actinomycetota bacterium]
MYKKIVVGTDFSPTAKVATDRAATLAKKLNADLTLVHAGQDRTGQLKELGKEYGAETVAKEGPPADVLVSEAERLGSDLLVVGSVGMSGARRFLLGSVPNKVSHHVGTDLLIVKTDRPNAKGENYKGILVGTDGSPTATRAVEAAAGLAAALGITPLIVCAYEPPSEEELNRLRSDPNDPVAQWKAGRTQRETPDEFRWRIAAASQAEDILERAQEHASKAGATAETRAVEGNPAEALISLAEKEGFDLIVVGSVGMTGAKRFKLGNVPHRVSHHAPTDVLILRTT